MAMTPSPSSRWQYLYTNVVPIVAVNLVRCVLGDQSEPTASQLHLHRTVHFAKVDDPFALLTIDPPTQHQEQQLRRYHASTRTPPRARPGFRRYGLYPFEGHHRVFFHIRSAAGSSQSTRARS